jgi:hypothetical protein
MSLREKNSPKILRVSIENNKFVAAKRCENFANVKNAPFAGFSAKSNLIFLHIEIRFTIFATSNIHKPEYYKHNSKGI